MRGGGLGFDLLAAFKKRGDLMLAIGDRGDPLGSDPADADVPSDFMLGVSMVFSVMILMVSLFIRKPLEFNAFPTVLLIATMLRLALNLASTRLILGEGHTGTDAAGEVIQAFGSFMMQGNPVIGVIVFGILVIVNFIVITKGSGRIAEVAARFSLDAMPGKQMAIDADLSVRIDQRGRSSKAPGRTEPGKRLLRFAMDGASKFVRGDAIAGLLITLINVIGGMIIGMAQQGMSFADASTTYTVLTVGDGLVTQIPALIVSTAAGMLVTKGGTEGTADEALFGQLGGYPKALALSSGVMIIMALLPGIPKIPFLLIAAVAGGGAYFLWRQQEDAVKEADQMELAAAEAPPPEEPISSALHIDLAAA